MFKAGVCVAGNSAEQEIYVRPDNLKCGLPFPKQAFHSVCVVLGSLNYSCLRTNKETSTAVAMWRRVHPDRQGVDAEHACSFKMRTQPTGWKKTFLFKAAVCIDSVSAEEVLNAQSDNFFAQLHFPLHAYYSVCRRCRRVSSVCWPRTRAITWPCLCHAQNGWVESMLRRIRHQASNYAAPAYVVVESHTRQGLVRQYACGPFNTCVVGEPREAPITSQNGAPRAQVRAGNRL